MVGFFALPVFSNAQIPEKKMLLFSTGNPGKRNGTLKGPPTTTQVILPPNKRSNQHSYRDLRPKHDSMYGIFIYFTIHFGPISHGKCVLINIYHIYIYLVKPGMLIKLQGLNFNQERIRFWMDPSLLQISFLHHTHHLSNHRSCQLWIKGGLKRRVPWLVEMFEKPPKNPVNMRGGGYTTWKVDG